MRTTPDGSETRTRLETFPPTLFLLYQDGASDSPVVRHADALVARRDRLDLESARGRALAEIEATREWAEGLTDTVTLETLATELARLRSNPS